MFRFCDPKEHNAPIIRRNGPNPVASHLPSMKEVVDIMAMKDWDTVPFDEGAGNKSFRNCFEGNCPEKGLSYSIHNLVCLSLAASLPVISFFSI